MKVVRSRRALFIAAAIGATSGAVAFGLVPAGSAAAPPYSQPVTVTNTVSNPVPVSGSVGVTGTVGVDNFPQSQTVNGNVGVTGTVGVNNFPATQTVNGNVGIDPNSNHVQVDNLPTAQTVNGSGPGGTTCSAATPCKFVQTGATTSIIQDGEPLVPPGTTTDILGKYVDTTPYKEVTFYLSTSAPAGTQSCSFATHDPVGGFNFTLNNVTLPSGTVLVQTFDPAPPSLDLVCDNNYLAGGGSVPYTFMIVGRSN
jgi:hypothetical protein